MTDEATDLERLIGSYFTNNDWLADMDSGGDPDND
jgi:hypothetical protein